MDSRKKSLVEHISSKGFAAPEEMAAVFHVSPITIRRDFIWLENAGFIRRVHGGAVPNDPSNAIIDIGARSRIAINEKKSIAKLAVSMIKPGYRIFLDCGSTCRFLAEAIQESPDLTVVTYSLDSINVIALKKQIRLIVPGGELNSRINAFTGQITETALSSYHFDIAFLGTTGLDLSKGLTDNSTIESGIKRLAATNSDKCVILADGLKLGKVALKTFLRLDEVPLTVITDSNAPEHICASLQEKGITIKIAQTLV